jgi:glycosyltransferase involved in cell wall biosynthesis
MNRLRVVHIITKLEIGGAEQNTLYSVEHLNSSLFEAHLIVGPGGLLDKETEKLTGVGIQFCGELSREKIRPLADFDAYQKLRGMLRELKPDIVHTHWSKAGIVGRLAAAAENVPVIVHTYHGFGFHQFQPPGAFRLSVSLDREANRRSHHLIFVSWQNGKWAEEMDLIQNCSTSLIRTGVEVEPLLQAKASEEFRNEFGIPRRAKVVGMIASLRPQKDPLTFVEAASLVVQKEDDVKFLLFGDGELADAVSRRASKELRAANFQQAGWSRNVPEVLANLDLLVVPSLWEGLPRIIPEATIAGVPVVASQVDGIREIIFEGRNGAFAEPHNPQDFAEKILRALKEDWKVDPELSRQIQHEYDIREMVRQEEALYLRLMAAARSRN